MKVMILASVFLLSSLASASYNTDAIKGEVRCTGKGVSVTINANRSQFVITENGTPSTYNVSTHNGDGDTAITYVGKLQFSLTGITSSLTFSDRGDQLEVSGRTIALRCPQG